MSTHRTDEIQISRRYGQAIFALATEAKHTAAVAAEFLALGAAIRANSSLSDALASPLVNHAQKREILLGLMSKASDITRRAIETIAESGRASLVPAIADDLKARLAAEQGELEATITSARALPTPTQKQLEQSLAKATGKKVTLRLKEDASVLGGLLIELGSLRLDATLSGALTHMRQQLLTATH